LIVGWFWFTGFISLVFLHPCLSLEDNRGFYFYAENLTGIKPPKRVVTTDMYQLVISAQFSNRYLGFFGFLVPLMILSDLACGVACLRMTNTLLQPRAEVCLLSVLKYYSKVDSYCRCVDE